MLKKTSIGFLLTAITITMLCCKDEMNLPINTPDSQRKIRFQLSTTRDYSKFNDTIIFTLFIRNLNNKILWDSTFKPITVAEIPEPKSKWIADKIVPNDDNSVLRVGFDYYIKNVGYSWYLDTCGLGNNLKVIDFNF
ncbi:MAG: hypothetical protein RLZZ306_2234 [Bacteroidota bacterium]